MSDERKRKRQTIASNIQYRPRINSKQKRRTIEANLQKFIRQVNQSKPIPSMNHISYSANVSKNSIQSEQNISNKIIQPKMKNKQIGSPRFRSSTDVRQYNNFDNQKNNNKRNQELQRRNNGNFGKQENNEDHHSLDNQPQSHNMVQNSPQKQQEKPNENKPKQLQPKPTIQRHISFGSQSLPPVYSPPPNNQPQLKNFTNQPNPQYPQIIQPKPIQPQPSQKKQQHLNDLHFDYNQSKYASSSNGSSAIFYTSQFKQYINRDQPHTTTNPEPLPKPQSHKIQKNQSSHQHRTTTDKQINQSFLKIGQQQLSQLTQSKNRKLQHIQSGRSLAFSNNDQSLLLKNNHNNQYEKQVQQIVNKKLDQQLVLEIQHFSQNKFQEFVQKNIYKLKKIEIKSIVRDLMLVKKINLFRKKIELLILRYYFDGFLMLNQYRYQLTKYDIKINNFIKQKNTNSTKSIFTSWKSLKSLTSQKVHHHTLLLQQILKKNIFEVFRIIWYDKKVKNQTDLYYLSKIFTTLRNTIEKNKKYKETTALKFYCRSLKKYYFGKIKQGVSAMKKQKQQIQLACDHLRFSTMKKFFDSWVDICERKPEYIKISMTAKNVFKQTLDRKWMGIKTVDFRQIKE